MATIGMGVMGGANAVTAFAGSMTSYFQAANQAKYAKRMQAFHNKMVRMSNTVNQNAITQNTVQAKLANSALQEKIQRQGNSYRGKVAVQAGATGTVGNSRQQSMAAVSRDEAQAEFNRMEDRHFIDRKEYQQRTNSLMAMYNNLDYTRIESPSFGTALLGGLAGAASAYLSTPGLANNTGWTDPLATGGAALSDTSWNAGMQNQPTQQVGSQSQSFTQSYGNAIFGNSIKNNFLGL